MSTSVSDYYQVGDVIYQGKPFVRVFQHEAWDKICANCTAENATLKKCGGCGTMKYCGRNCQREDWAYHKVECPFLRNYTNREDQILVQLVGNIILKLKGRGWKTVTETVLDKKVSFDDLLSHSGSGKDPCQFIDLESFKSNLISYIGVENLPDDNSLKEIIGKVYVNGFGFTAENFINEYFPRNYQFKNFFIGLSKFDHSCVPNAVRHFNLTTSTTRVIARKVIHKKKEKVTFSYGPLVTQIDSHAFFLGMKNSFLVGCYCDDCSQPYGKSTLTKIIDPGKAHGVILETQSFLLLVTLLKKFGYPTGIVTRDKVQELLQKLDGVLGKTNLVRIRTLAIRGLFVEGGSADEKRRDLMELEEAMIEAWGENFHELFIVYKELIDVNLKLDNSEDATKYTMKINELCSIFGE